MLSHTLNEMRREALNYAHGGRVLTGDDMVGLAARLAALEAEAASLEAIIRGAQTLAALTRGIPRNKAARR
jgi:hypothetical protein